MRFEHDRGGAPAAFPAEVAGAAEHGLMSAMHAVEIADGENRALGRRGHITPAGEDVHSCIPGECAIVCATRKPLATVMRYAPRRGTIMRASPSNTLLPLTVAWVANPARPCSASRP